MPISRMCMHFSWSISRCLGLSEVKQRGKKEKGRPGTRRELPCSMYLMIFCLDSTLIPAGYPSSVDGQSFKPDRQCISEYANTQLRSQVIVSIENLRRKDVTARDTLVKSPGFHRSNGQEARSACRECFMYVNALVNYDQSQASLASPMETPSIIVTISQEEATGQLMHYDLSIEISSLKFFLHNVSCQTSRQVRLFPSYRCSHSRCL